MLKEKVDAMNEQEARDFLRTHHQAILATIRKDGRPQLSNVLTSYHDGRMLVSITETRAKYHNLVRDPRATLLVLGDNFWQYITIDGTAELARLPGAAPLLRQYYELSAGKPHPNWEEYDEAMRQERRVLASFSIEKLYPLSD